jgi:tetrahydromethanopterin S-methyltransferase subunit D
MANRFHKHLYGGSGSAIVHAAVQKYGLDQFAFIVLGTLPPFTSAEGNAELLDLENFYLQLLTPAYNLARGFYPRPGDRKLGIRMVCSIPLRLRLL